MLFGLHPDLRVRQVDKDQGIMRHAGEPFLHPVQSLPLRTEEAAPREGQAQDFFPEGIQVVKKLVSTRAVKKFSDLNDRYLGSSAKVLHAKVQQDR